MSNWNFFRIFLIMKPKKINHIGQPLDCIHSEYEMDMKEDIKSTINNNDNKVSVKIGKFEIKTIAFELDI